ncbi:light-mediated development protein DET1 isoform X7 [Lycium barbarum]|uniref:light-mediated development protein DET1 isoform X7 n=1 Tax=Lycium barbarum TaxID=112863 RepID=UPI00293EF6A8|nr:light-mediated development protein DET1 isoform X7 [Lycium barbarum]
MFKSNNVTARLFERQISTPAPGTAIHRARRFYENIVPGYTIYDVECPDHSFRKFTDDGLYLISFSRNHQDLIVYRPTWLTFSCKEEDCDSHDLPLKARKFESFFTQLYSVNLASSGELICKDFFLYMESNQFGLFATSTAQIHDAPPTGGAIQGVPSVEKITFYLLRLEDGARLDERVFHNDYVNLAHSIGAFLYDDLLAIVSLRYQRIHILQIRDSGDLVDVRAIGEFCREDDELFLNFNSQVLVNHVGNGFHHSMPELETSFMGGIKQRLLSFIFRGIWNEETDQTMRVQCLKKKFYFHFQDYIDLIIWKVSRNADSHPSFFAVYNMETTEIVAFYQFVKKMMASLPFSCQSQSPSPYFDQSLFRFDEKLISAIDRHRQSTDHPIKFISRRQPNILKFKMKPGPEAGSTDGRTKKICSFLFHPILPLALSVQQTLFLQASVVNIHFRR